MLSSLILLCYLLHAHPFNHPLLNYMEIFSELTVLLAAYHLLLFDSIDDSELYFDSGWSLIAVTLVSIVVNFTIMTCSSIFDLITFMKRLYTKCKIKHQS